MTGNDVLAARAGALADAAEPRSLAQRAARCCQIALATTSTLGGARKALCENLGIATVRAAAEQLLADLAGEARP